MDYELYLESGPQHRKTWIYVPSLPGCSTVAATSELAPEAAREAIVDRLAFLRSHGEKVDSDPPTVSVAEHAIERQTLGFGQRFWPPDLPPLSQDEVPRLMRWAEWSREALIAAARRQSRPMEARPDSGRSTLTILAHVAGAEWAYVSGTLGTLPGGSARIAAIEAAGDEPWAAMAAERAAIVARLEAMTPEDLRRVVEKKGQPHWTARRMFRRLLEHEWEHTRELESRLG